MNIRIGVDLGGTKIEAAALDETGAECWSKRVPTPHDDYEGIVKAIAGLVGQLEDQLGTRGVVGIGTPGSVSPQSGLHRNSNTTVLNGRPFESDLSAALDRTVRTTNDANCLALSEAIDGAASGHSIVFGVIMGTGVGGGVVINREVVGGCNGIAGEWGHIELREIDERRRCAHPCYCGLHGCLEQFMSGPAVQEHYRQKSGTSLEAPAIVEAARNGEPMALAVLEQLYEDTARALATVINILDPDIFVIGGGLSNIPELFENVPGRLASFSFADSIATPVVPATHGDSSGVRGAAWLWTLQEAADSSSPGRPSGSAR